MDSKTFQEGKQDVGWAQQMPIWLQDVWGYVSRSWRRGSVKKDWDVLSIRKAQENRIRSVVLPSCPLFPEAVCSWGIWETPGCLSAPPKKSGSRHLLSTPQSWFILKESYNVSFLKLSGGYRVLNSSLNLLNIWNILYLICKRKNSKTFWKSVFLK